MKTLIVYASTYGFTKECVQKLASQLGGEVVQVNVQADKTPQLKEFDNIIIGGSIYIGQIQREIKAFCTNNIQELDNKRIGLFICCGQQENFDQAMKNSFPEKLIEKAEIKECFGGELRVNNMKFLHKMICKIIVKAAEKEGKPMPKPAFENIAKLAAAFKA